MAKEGRFSEDELEWIYDCLDEHGEYLGDLLRDAIDERELIQSESLHNSISYYVARNLTNPTLFVSFNTYGRLFEIQANRKNKTLLQMMGSDPLKDKMESLRSRRKKKNKKWYAKTAYGSLNRLISILMYEYTDDIRANIKARLERYNTNPQIVSDLKKFRAKQRA